MRKTKLIITILIVLVILSFIFGRRKVFTETRFMMDTVCEIKVIARLKPRKAFNEAFKVIHRIDSLASFEGTGDIARINKGETVELSPEVAFLINEGLKIGQFTQGTFDIAIRPCLEVWGDFKEEIIPAEDEIKAVLPLVNYQNVEIANNRVSFKQDSMQLDLSGIAKGYAVDLAVEKLKSMGIKTGLVNAGGDIRVFGEKVWKIGVKHPREPGVIKVLKLKNKAVATSGDYEKYFIKDGVRYHHIFNPKTGYPARKCVSVTVIGDDAMYADALATAVFVLGPEKGLALLDSLNIPGLITTPDLKLIQSKAFTPFIDK